jgi:hypothetical protein
MKCSRYAVVTGRFGTQYSATRNYQLNFLNNMPLPGYQSGRISVAPPHYFSLLETGTQVHEERRPMTYQEIVDVSNMDVMNRLFAQQPKAYAVRRAWLDNCRV